MRVDIVSIFPEYLAPLDLSLVGKAREAGLIDLHIHNLRDWTHDPHHTVDDSPAGGGAGMVMKPEPWGEAFEALGLSGATVVVPTPAGRPFTQGLARELATKTRLVIACGRYEGIDQRVIDYAEDHAEVVEVSLGDYVLNGGEVAALVIVEAVGRLLPGFVGNPDSLAEESHEDGLLEYPVYTKPREWRDLEIPAVLLSGDHGAIAAWRHDQAVRRTVARRPDLMHPSSINEAGDLRLAQPSDAGELLTLQKACWVQEQEANPGVEIPPLHETLDDVLAWMQEWTVLVLRRGGRLIGAARGRAHGELWDVGRLMVAPDLQGQGIGRRLLTAIEAAAPPDVTSYELFTGASSTRNQRLYRRAGYSLRPELPAPEGAVLLTRRGPRRDGHD